MFSTRIPILWLVVGMLSFAVWAQTYAATEEIFPSQTLRLSWSYQFFDSFTNNNDNSKFLRKTSSAVIIESQDYNLGADPIFDWTPSFAAAWYTVQPNAKDVEVITAKTDYYIQAVPSARRGDNLVVKYILEYYSDMNKN